MIVSRSCTVHDLRKRESCAYDSNEFIERGNVA
jgi:hypothetical protein